MRLIDMITAYQIRNGNVQAFEDLINKYKFKIFNYCLRITNQYDITDDITQEVFIKVYNNIGSYDSSKASLSTWIFSIAHNCCVNALRSLTKNLSLDELDVEPAIDNLDNQLITNDYVRKLDCILSLLPQEDKSLIIMKDYLGLKGSEISKIIGIPEGTIKSRLYSIRRKIREELGDYND